VTAPLKLHGWVVNDAGQFRAECWLQDENANPSEQESRVFMTLQDARIGLEQLSQRARHRQSAPQQSPRRKPVGGLQQSN
jgi:hypothetical protein